MRVIIATDGSSYSKEAIAEFARLVGCTKGAEIKIVSAYEDTYPITTEPYMVSSEYFQKLQEGMVQLAQGFLDEAESLIRQQAPDHELTITKEILHGAPDQEIIEIAKAWTADLIVVGSHGRGFWGRLLGSVSDGVVHHAPCSVLVVRK